MFIFKKHTFKDEVYYNIANLDKEANINKKILSTNIIKPSTTAYLQHRLGYMCVWDKQNTKMGLLKGGAKLFLW